MPADLDQGADPAGMARQLLALDRSDAVDALFRRETQDGRSWWYDIFAARQELGEYRGLLEEAIDILQQDLTWGRIGPHLASRLGTLCFYLLIRASLVSLTDSLPAELIV